MDGRLDSFDSNCLCMGFIWARQQPLSTSKLQFDPLPQWPSTPNHLTTRSRPTQHSIPILRFSIARHNSLSSYGIRHCVVGPYSSITIQPHPEPHPQPHPRLSRASEPWTHLHPCCGHAVGDADIPMTMSARHAVYSDLCPCFDLWVLASPQQRTPRQSRTQKSKQGHKLL